MTGEEFHASLLNLNITGNLSGLRFITEPSDFYTALLKHTGL